MFPLVLDWLIDLHLGSGPLSPDALRPWFNGPFLPHIESWEPRNITTVPDGPQAYTPDIRQLRDKGAQVRMSEWGQSLMLKECGPRFPLLPHTSCTRDRQAALIGKDVSSGYSHLISHQVASDCLCLQVFRRSSESWTAVLCTQCMTTKHTTQMNWVSRRGTSWSCFVKGTSGNESGGGLDSVTRRAIFHGTCLGYVFLKVLIV